MRHGESEANRAKLFAEDDTPLTDLGRQQARAVAEKIAERFHPSVVVSSTLPRAEETAQIIAARLGVRLELVPELQERDFGALKGRSYVHFREWIAADPTYDPARPWAWTPEGGESLEAVQTRVIAALERLRRRHPDEEILVVFHGAAMQAVCAHLAGAWEGTDIPKNCGVIQLEHTGAGFGAPVVLTDCSVAEG